MSPDIQMTGINSNDTVTSLTTPGSIAQLESGYAAPSTNTPKDEEGGYVNSGPTSYPVLEEVEGGGAITGVDPYDYNGPDSPDSDNQSDSGGAMYVPGKKQTPGKGKKAPTAAFDNGMEEKVASGSNTDSDGDIYDAAPVGRESKKGPPATYASVMDENAGNNSSSEDDIYKEAPVGRGSTASAPFGRGSTSSPTSQYRE